MFCAVARASPADPTEVSGWIASALCVLLFLRSRELAAQERRDVTNAKRRGLAHRSKSHGRRVGSGTSNSSAEYGENMRLEGGMVVG